MRQGRAARPLPRTPYDDDGRDTYGGPPDAQRSAGDRQYRDQPREGTRRDPRGGPARQASAEQPDAGPPPGRPGRGERDQPGRPGSRADSGPGRDEKPEAAAHPDWADDSQHPGFFQGFGNDEGVDPPRRKKRKRGRWAAPLISVLVILAVIVAAAGYVVHHYEVTHANYSGDGTGRVIVTVKEHDSAFSLAPQLIRLGVIKAADPFTAAAKESANAGSLLPGTFLLHRHMNAAKAWALLLNPKSRLQTTVSVVDGQRATDIIASLARQTHKPLAEFKDALAATKQLGLPSYAHGNPEGFLFPATYNFPPDTTPLKMLQTMVQAFKTQTESLGLAAAAKKGHLTQEQVITEASLLEAEVDPKDYTKVAQVIDNRLNRRPEMTLGLDSTVLYALHLPGTFNLSKKQLAVNSPYNTTNRLGLPPGPIDSPSLAAIKAVLHPTKGNWLFFVTVNPKTGLTKFTNSYTQFQIWSRESSKAIKDGT